MTSKEAMGYFQERLIYLQQREERGPVTQEEYNELWLLKMIADLVLGKYK